MLAARAWGPGFVLDELWCVDVVFEATDLCEVGLVEGGYGAVASNSGDE